MKEKKSIRTMDIILAVIAVFLLLFIVVMQSRTHFAHAYLLPAEGSAVSWAG